MPLARTIHQRAFAGGVALLWAGHVAAATHCTIIGRASDIARSELGVSPPRRHAFAFRSADAASGSQLDARKADPEVLGPYCAGGAGAYAKAQEVEAEMVKDCTEQRPATSHRAECCRMG